MLGWFPFPSRRLFFADRPPSADRCNTGSLLPTISINEPGMKLMIREYKQMLKNVSSSDSNQKASTPPLSKGEAFRRDFFASIVVFLVALPLCIGIAVAVGANPARALITGIVGGLIVGFISGSPLQVSGPAAGLFVIVADLIERSKQQYLESAPAALSSEALEANALEYAMLAMGAAVLLGGLIQYAAGRLQLGQWFRAVSPAVIRGMLAGIGVLILVSQFHVMLDHPAMWHGEKAHGGWQYAATIPEAIWKCFAHTETKTHHLAAATGLITIATIVLWQGLMPKKIRLIPASLVAVIVATLFAFVTNLDVQKLEVPSNMFSEVSLPNLTTLQLIVDPNILLTGLVIAIVASAETLLCATAVDQMQNGPRTDYDKELRGQGIGNTICGLLGALPMTGVIVRSSANVQAGAVSRTSSILHGAWLLLFVAFLPVLLEYIPKAALGGLLVYTGYKLINFKSIRELWQLSRSEFAIYMVTLTLIVMEDLLVGVVVGVILSAVKLLHRFSKLELELVDVAPGKQRLLMKGACTFLRLPMLARELEGVQRGGELHVDFNELRYIDHACLELLMTWAKQHESLGGTMVLDWDQLHARFKADTRANKRVEMPAALEPQAVVIDLTTLPMGRRAELERMALTEMGVQSVTIEGGDSNGRRSAAETGDAQKGNAGTERVILHCSPAEVAVIRKRIQDWLEDAAIPS